MSSVFPDNDGSQNIGAAETARLSIEMESALSDDLLRLSFRDRNEINEEIHGVRNLAVEETPRLIANALYCFRIQLEMLLPVYKRAYMYILHQRQHLEQLQLQQLNPYRSFLTNTSSSSPANNITNTNTAVVIYAVYADSDEFRLRFLRSSLFCVPRAVRRFANYLNFIQDYYGDSYLARPIQLSDLDAATMKVMEGGFVQLLPVRDRKGRRIIAMLGNGSDLEDIATIKAGFYLFDAATRDCVETQRNGLVIIAEGSNWKYQKRHDLLTHIRQRASKTYSHFERAHLCLPYRLAAHHFCWPDSPSKWILSKSYLLKESLIRLSGKNTSDSALEMNRIQFHNGDETEMRYSVKSYGIAIEALPLTGTNAIKLGYHNRWIQTRKLVEDNLNRYHKEADANDHQTINTNNNINNNGVKTEYEVKYEKIGSEGKKEYVTIVECPCLNDVVFRSGTQSMENPGNDMFRNKIIEYWAEKEEPEYPPSTSSSGISSSSSSTKKTIDDTLDREFRDQLVKDIGMVGGRFLEWDKKLGLWVQIDDKARIHRKVDMAFYNYTKRRQNPNPVSQRRQRCGTIIKQKSTSSNGGAGRSTTTTNENHDNARRSSSTRAIATISTSSSPTVSAMNEWNFTDRGSSPSCFSTFCGNDNIDNELIDDIRSNESNKRSCLAWPFVLPPPPPPPSSS